MIYKLLVVRTDGIPRVRTSRDGDKLVSKAHELIDTDQASWVMVSNETLCTILLTRSA